MGAARSLLCADVWALDVKAVDRVAVGQGVTGGGKIAKRGDHGVGRAGDDGRVEPRDAGGEESAEGAGDLVVGSGGVVEIDAGEAVNLEVDEAGREVEIGGKMVNRAAGEHHLVEGDFER